MAGHSKWHNIKHKKAKADKARSNLFTKLLRYIVVAAQQGGGDPDMNFALRLAIQKARAGNVPKDNIERAIKKGVGETDGSSVFEEGLYEGFGPGGVALLIEALTDNKNRTVSDIKYILSKKGGSSAGSGSVQWQFERKSVVRITKEKKDVMKNWETIELEIIDAGVDDILESEHGVEIIAPVEKLKNILDICTTHMIELEDSGLEWLPKETVEIDPPTQEKLHNLLEALEENDDVKEVYTNVA
tara:strand:+ start:261 stop:992 length:732 start_codon:yes stop_codon:yes gene_type:complete